MNTLPYKVIKTETQYNQYCKTLEELLMRKKKSKNEKDLIDLLTLLIEKWDEKHNTFSESDPIELLRYLMDENKLKSVDLAGELAISTSLVSDILHYRRGLSKEMIRKLADKFKVSQELFNRPYKLLSPDNSQMHGATSKKGKEIHSSKKQVNSSSTAGRLTAYAAR